jgi:hypothetical protein
MDASEDLVILYNAAAKSRDNRVLDAVKVVEEKLKNGPPTYDEVESFVESELSKAEGFDDWQRMAVKMAYDFIIKSMSPTIALNSDSTKQIVNLCHFISGATDTREWTDEEKIARGFSPKDMCGHAGSFSIEKIK